METQGQGHEEPGHRDTAPEGQAPLPNITLSDDELATHGLRRIDEDTTGDIRPVEPTARAIEEGINDAAAFLSESTGRKFPTEDLDNDTKKLLYDIHKQRKGWTKSMEDDAAATLQLLYPDVSGSAPNGPL